MTGGLREEADTRIACALTWAGDKSPAFAALFSTCERGLASVVFIGRSVLGVPGKIQGVPTSSYPALARLGRADAWLSVGPSNPSFPRRRESIDSARLDSRLRGNDGKGSPTSSSRGPTSSSRGRPLRHREPTPPAVIARPKAVAIHDFDGVTG